MEFDINEFISIPHQNNRYNRRLEQLKYLGVKTRCIEEAVTGATDNVRQGVTRAFVIYGEPQSGKTEMMIALTARLLDDGHKIIIHLLNDSVQLLEQNLDRFRRSGLAPTPCNFLDILDPEIKIGDEERVIFCKKNPNDLKKLIEKINHKDSKIIIDDEADYATPNAKVNKGERTRINELIKTLLKDKGIYIGVTATPARLDLNYTFENDHEKWVDFPPHEKYTGQNIFFPAPIPSDGYKFRIKLISDHGDEPKHCREALFSFLVNAGYLNLHPEIHKGPQNYSFLVHTSGKTDDHKRDYKVLHKVFGVLIDQNSKDYKTYVEQIWNLAERRYPKNGNAITKYVLEHAGCKNIVVMNSKDFTKDYKSATSPAAPFTVIVGGNIVSRGVTFDNLLSMYFTRDVKHKLQQDTYIQRARMFGSRGDYLEYFELTIPEALYFDWHRCFIFHRLSLEAIKSGKGAPAWLGDSRIQAVASSSVNKANISLDSGEMSFGIFDYSAVAENVMRVLNSSEKTHLQLKKLQTILGESFFPEYILSFVHNFNPKGDEAIMLHQPYSIVDIKDADQEKIERKKAFMGGAAFTKNPQVMHHFRILFNKDNKARLFYKYTGNVSFLKNTKGQSDRMAA